MGESGGVQVRGAGERPLFNTALMTTKTGKAAVLVEAGQPLELLEREFHVKMGGVLVRVLSSHILSHTGFVLSGKVVTIHPCVIPHSPCTSMLLSVVTVAPPTASKAALGFTTNHRTTNTHKHTPAHALLFLLCSFVLGYQKSHDPALMWGCTVSCPCPCSPAATPVPSSLAGLALHSRPLLCGGGGGGGQGCRGRGTLPRTTRPVHLLPADPRWRRRLPRIHPGTPSIPQLLSVTLNLPGTSSFPSFPVPLNALMFSLSLSYSVFFSLSLILSFSLSFPRVLCFIITSLFLTLACSLSLLCSLSPHLFLTHACSLSLSLSLVRFAPLMCSPFNKHTHTYWNTAVSCIPKEWAGIFFLSVPCAGGLVWNHSWLCPSHRAVEGWGLCRVRLLSSRVCIPHPRRGAQDPPRVMCKTFGTPLPVSILIPLHSKWLFLFVVVSICLPGCLHFVPSPGDRQLHGHRHWGLAPWGLQGWTGRSGEWGNRQYW